MALMGHKMFLFFGFFGFFFLVFVCGYLCIGHIKILRFG